jgi:membrane protein YdbS with pleckstrin-like domain
MLTVEEEKFVQFWEQNRQEYSKFTSKLLRGIPMASIFALPILLLILCVYLFLPEWYMKISKTSSQTFFVVIIAVFVVIFFYAFARMHFKWEMNDQLYQELKMKEKRTKAAN